MMVVVAGAAAVEIRLMVGAVLAAVVATARQIPYKLQAPAVVDVSEQRLSGSRLMLQQPDRFHTSCRLLQ